MPLPDCQPLESDTALRNPDALQRHLESLPGCAVEEIGRSREDRPLFGVRFGRGPRRVSITAGAHADEPAGPMAAQALPRLLAMCAPDLLDNWEFRVAPQVNPDGHERNRPWFSAEPDFVPYVQNTIREAPGDDIEFGYADTGEARPECRAVLQFLKGDAPYAAHFSLHGMAYAQGAWFLLCQEWADRAAPVLDALRDYCAADAFPLHDMERHGDKGFHRLGPGGCTTPVSTAMRAHFLQLDDPEMAAKFLPSSMEAVSAWGGDTLCMVSEMPLFCISHPDGTLEHPALHLLRDAMQGIDRSDAGALANIAREFSVQPVPYTVQIRYQVAMMVAALRFRQAME